MTKKYTIKSVKNYEDDDHYIFRSVFGVVEPILHLVKKWDINVKEFLKEDKKCLHIKLSGKSKDINNFVVAFLTKYSQDYDITKGYH